MSIIRVELPAHLRTLARIPGHEVELEVAAPATLASVLDVLEAAYPMLRGTIRDQTTRQRRAFLRFFACQQDLSHAFPDAPLPDAVIAGREPLIILGAIAGGCTAPQFIIAMKLSDQPSPSTAVPWRRMQRWEPC